MTNEETVFYNMLKGGATPEEISKAMTAAQKILDKEKADEEAKKAKEAEQAKEVEVARKNLVRNLGEYLAALCPNDYPKDRTAKEWETLYKTFDADLKACEKLITNSKAKADKNEISMIDLLNWLF